MDSTFLFSPCEFELAYSSLDTNCSSLRIKANCIGCSRLRLEREPCFCGRREDSRLGREAVPGKKLHPARPKSPPGRRTGSTSRPNHDKRDQTPSRPQVAQLRPRRVPDHRAAETMPVAPSRVSRIEQADALKAQAQFLETKSHSSFDGA
jgi:hypothetical protein